MFKRQISAYTDTKSFIILSSIAAISYAIYLYQQHFLFIQYDAYYYAAVADSLIHNGALLNNAHDPASAIMTPQIGIVFVHLILYKIGFHEIESRLIILLFLNAAIMVVCCTVLFRLFIFFNIQRQAAFLASFSAAISFYFYMVLLQPINDGIFICLNLLALNLILSKNATRSKLVILTIIAITIGYFRLSGFIIFIVPAFIYFLKKNYRQGVTFFLFTAISLASPFIITLLVHTDSSGLSKQTQDMFSLYSFQYFKDHLNTTIGLSIPELFLRMTYFTSGFSIPSAIYGYIISIPVIVVLLWLTYKSFRNKETATLILCSIFIAYLFYFQAYRAQPTRYIILLSFLLPYLLLIAIPFKRQKIWSVVYLSLICVVSAAAMITNDKNMMGKLKHDYKVKIQKVTKQDDLLLYSHFPRVTYFLIGRPAQSSFRPLNNLDNTAKKILIVGPNPYIKYILQQIQPLEDRYIIKYEKLTTSYIEYQKSNTPGFAFKYEPREIFTLLVTLSNNPKNSAK